MPFPNGFLESRTPTPHSSASTSSQPERPTLPPASTLTQHADAQESQQVAQRSRWQAVFLEAGGISAALSEESMRRLRYCLQWLQVRRPVFAQCHKCACLWLIHLVRSYSTLPHRSTLRSWSSVTSLPRSNPTVARAALHPYRHSTYARCRRRNAMSCTRFVRL